MFLNDLVDLIETNTSLTVGTNLWPHHFPKDEDTGVAIHFAGGTESESNMARYLCQITSIGADAATAESQITEVYELLAYNNGVLLSSGRIFNIVPLSVIKFVHINKHNYPVFTASVVIIKERT